MISQILHAILSRLPIPVAHAHCDIPCGIYDPHAAQLAAKTVLVMVQKIKALEPPGANVDTMNEHHNSLVRMIEVKEEHAEICKREVLILWTDYFTPEHAEKFPDLHTLVWKTAKLCSENKRTVSEEKAKELIGAVDVIADIFRQTR